MAFVKKPKVVAIDINKVADQLIEMATKRKELERQVLEMKAEEKPIQALLYSYVESQPDNKFEHDGFIIAEKSRIGYTFSGDVQKLEQQIKEMSLVLKAKMANEITTKVAKEDKDKSIKWIEVREISEK